MTPADLAALELTRHLANEGKLIEGGFAAYVRINRVDINRPEMIAMHDAYMSGAEHLMSSIMATLDPGVAETDADMARMDSIMAELGKWRQAKMDAMARAYRTEGNA